MTEWDREASLTIQEMIFYLFVLSVLVKQDDFKQFRRMAKHGGDVIFEYLKEARSFFVTLQTSLIHMKRKCNNP